MVLEYFSEYIISGNTYHVTMQMPQLIVLSVVL